MGLLGALGIEKLDRASISKISKKLKIRTAELEYLNQQNILPDTLVLERIEKHFGTSPIELKIRMGIIDKEILDLLSSNATAISKLSSPTKEYSSKTVNPEFTSELGKLFRGDCLDIMRQMEDNSVDLFFADPPFNLNKLYLSEIDDNLTSKEYLDWCYEWIEEGIRILKPGGSFFIWNIPKWNTYLSSYLNNKLTFRHWIACDLKMSLKIQGRLYPSHYSLLYYIKGEKPNVFKPDRLPMETCPKCFGDLKDYGGYKDKMNPLGVNITDVWYDIPPVRHNKYKTRKEANELSIKLMDRIIEMSTNEGDIVFDPFGGAGTTFVTAELKNRKWLGSELGPLDSIISRFDNIKVESDYLSSYRSNYNVLFPEKIKLKRKRLDLWTDDSFITTNGEKEKTDTRTKGAKQT
jgi:site-specific DNA-methyltransferase (adenine-specific)